MPAPDGTPLSAVAPPVCYLSLRDATEVLGLLQPPGLVIIAFGTEPGLPFADRAALKVRFPSDD